MNGLLASIRTRLERDRHLPLSARIRSGAEIVLRHTKGAFARALFLKDCDRVGFGTRIIGGAPRIENEGFIGLGDHVLLLCQAAPVHLAATNGGRVEIGSSVVMNFGTFIAADRLVRIGDRASMGQYCILSDTGGLGPHSDEATPAPIEIGPDVWLAARVTVLPGSRIGAGSVITSGSIVSGEIPPGVLAGGIPARVLRRLRPRESSKSAASNGELPGPISALNGHATPSHLEADKAVWSAPSSTREPSEHRLYLVSDFTLGELGRRLADPNAPPSVEVDVAPFGQVVPTLLQPAPAGSTALVVWTRPEVAVASFRRVLEFESVPEADLLAEVDAFCDLVITASQQYRATFVPTWTSPPWQRGLGMLDARDGGAWRALSAMNLRLMDRLGAQSGVFVLNAQRWTEGAAHGGHQPKLWYMGKVPFHSDVFAQAASDIKAALRGLTGAARKLLVVDLDNTIWGGVVGDVGWEGLRLGGHDSVGEALVDFQRAIKALKRRGIVLGIVSKNEEAVALEAIRRHPEMALREEDFVGWRINWNDKARNVADLAAELNLGLQSVVFIDDNPVERARVRETLPEVLVPDWPQDPLLYASSLRNLTCFDAPSIGREDLERTELYAAEQKRTALKAEVGSIEDWLKTLGISVRAAHLDRSNLARTVQLLNKTNQMNLSTRRLSESELWEWGENPDHHLWVFHVADRFGDAGLTGIVSLEAKDGVGHLVDFVLSCRVMGRKIEETMAYCAIEAARRRGLSRVEANYLATPKNKPCFEFWSHSGFDQRGELFVWPTAKAYPLPEAVQLEFTP